MFKSSDFFPKLAEMSKNHLYFKIKKLSQEGKKSILTLFKDYLECFENNFLRDSKFLAPTCLLVLGVEFGSRNLHGRYP
jgi:hypothetical protein